MVNQQEVVPDPPVFQQVPMEPRPKLQPPILLPYIPISSALPNNLPAITRSRSTTISARPKLTQPSGFFYPPEPVSVPSNNFPNLGTSAIPPVQRLQVPIPADPGKFKSKGTKVKRVAKPGIKKTQRVAPQPRVVPEIVQFPAPPQVYSHPQDPTFFYPQDPSPPISQSASGKSYIEL